MHDTRRFKVYASHPGSAAYELALLYVNAILGSLFAFQLTANQMRSC